MLRWEELDECGCGLRHWPEEDEMRHVLSLVSESSSAPSVWVSGDADKNRAEAHTEELHLAGVEHVLDMREQADGMSHWAKRENLKILEHRVPDSYHAFEEPTRLLRTLEVVGEKPALIHCHMGVNRSASAAVLLLVMRGMPAGEAVCAVLDGRESALCIYAPLALRNWIGERHGLEAIEAIHSRRSDDRRWRDLLKRRGENTLLL